MNRRDGTPKYREVGRGLGTVCRGRLVATIGLVTRLALGFAVLLALAPVPGDASQPQSNAFCTTGANTSPYDTCYGYATLSGENGGYQNSAFGYTALNANAVGADNTAIGSTALLHNNANDNTALGSAALYTNASGAYNVAGGVDALFSNTTGNYNTATGFQSLYTNTGGYGSTATGALALYSNTGNYNTATGAGAMQDNTTGAQDIADGYQALFWNSTGNYNTAAGFQALYSNTTGTFNTASGNQALFSNTTGNVNTALGDSALYYNTGSANTAAGEGALFRNTTGDNNTATGYWSLDNNTTGGANVASGDQALYSNTTGSNNTTLGYYAGVTGNSGNANTTGSNNTFLGYQAGPGTSTQLTNATAIGANAAVSESNALVLGASGTDVGIGTTTPDQALTVVGNIDVKSSGSHDGPSGGIEFANGSFQSSATTVTASPGAAGTYLRSDGTNWNSDAIQAGDLPNLSSQYVDLSSNQLVGGSKTFSSQLTVNGIVDSTSGGIEFPDGSIQTTAATSSGLPQGQEGNYLRYTNGSWEASNLLAGDLPAGSVNYIQNGTGQQAGASFNIAGSGTIAGTFGAGNAGIGITGAPNSTLQIGTYSQNFGTYVQLPTVASSGAPPASACNNTALVGRTVQVYSSARGTMTLYACSPTGKWVVEK